MYVPWLRQYEKVYYFNIGGSVASGEHQVEIGLHDSPLTLKQILTKNNQLPYPK